MSIRRIFLIFYLIYSLTLDENDATIPRNSKGRVKAERRPIDSNRNFDAQSYEARW
jgi:hypothetical protein